MKSTPPSVTKALDAVVKMPFLDELYYRWQDEQEYEDVKDYGKAFANNTPFEVLRCKKRPLAFVIRHPDFPEATYEVQMTRRCNRWRRLN